MFRLLPVNILDLFILSFVTLATAQSQSQTPGAIAAQYNLSLTNNLPFPSSGLTADSAVIFIQNDWSLARGRLDGTPNLNNPTPVAFVADPFPASSSANGPVLQVTYPAGSYSHNTGGAQFYSVFPSANTTLHLKSMLLSYEVAFDKDFDWVKGGKLPGVRGGSNNSGCSGGEQATGSDCFSLRLMWRTAGQGEVYGYIPTSTSLCSTPNVLCNPDFGTSIGRGLFSFQNGAWNRISFLVRLNDPPSASNGNIDLYFNDALAISKGNLQIRASDAVTLGGMFFSTFFGGDDSSWATPKEEHTYYRNIQMWGSEQATNTPNPSSSADATTTRGGSPLALLLIVLLSIML